MCNKMEFACILEALIDKNHTLKRIIPKICQETKPGTECCWLHCLELDWVLEVDSSSVLMKYFMGDPSSILSSLVARHLTKR